MRFGILCDGRTLAVWQQEVVRRLAAEDAVPALLIVDGRQPAAAPPGSRLRRLTRPNALWRIYSALEEPAALRREPMQPELLALPKVVCAPQTRGKFSEYFSAADVEAIRAYDLDFVLRFAFGIVRGEILQCARYGIWSFHHGDETRYRGGPPAFWEIYERNPITGAVLQRLTDRLDRGIILRRGYLKTIDYSYSRNLNILVNESTHWPASVAREIRETGGLSEFSESTSTAPIYRAPTNAQMLRYFSTLAFNIARRVRERGQREEWNVGIARLSPADVVRGGRVRDVVWYPRVRGGWVADPMARASNGTVHVLCERMKLETEKGYIAAIDFADGRWGEEQAAFDPGCHSSYPYLFEFEGQTFCLPETCEAGELQLYRAVEFPRRWERAGTMLPDARVADATLFEYGGRWWLFFTPEDATGHRLFAHYASSPFGPWTPHALNPVKVDVRASRPAGPPFVHDGVLYRPAQDSSRTYGGRVAVNEVLELTPTRFREATVSYLEPDPRSLYGRGLHTVCFAGGYCVIDGKRFRRR